MIPVDLFGLPVDYPQLREALPQGCFVLADAAQSIGGRLGNRSVGNLCEISSTSFFPAKPLGCYGDGGAVMTSDESLASGLLSLRAHGKGREKYDHLRIGTNSRLDTIQAAILRCKLEILDDEMERRQAIARAYSEALEPVVSIPSVPDGRQSAWAQYTIRTDDRDGLASTLRSHEVPTAIYYPVPLHRQPAYANYPVGPTGCGVSEQLSQRVLSLPMHPYVTQEDQEKVIMSVHEHFR